MKILGWLMVSLFGMVIFGMVFYKHGWMAIPVIATAVALTALFAFGLKLIFEN